MNYEKLITDCLSPETEQLRLDMAQILVNFGYQVQTTEHWVWGIPEVRTSSACLVAHLDTVRRDSFTPELTGSTLHNKAKCVLGADDRAGVYAIWEALGAGFRPYVLFTTGEEAMGIGVRDLIKNKILDPHLGQIDLFLEFDRQGVNEYVHYSDTIPNALAVWAESFGLVHAYGSYSDVADLTETYGIGHLNISVGYHEQHTPDERLDLIALDAAVLRIQWMLNSAVQRVRLTADQIHTPPRLTYTKQHNPKYMRTMPLYDRGAYAEEDCDYCTGKHCTEDCLFVDRYLSGVENQGTGQQDTHGGAVWQSYDIRGE